MAALSGNTGKGFYWGGLGTGGGQGVRRLQPINRAGRRTTSTTGARGLIFLDMHDVLTKIEQFKRKSGARFSAGSFAEAANRNAAIALQDLMVKYRQQNSVASRRRVSTGRLDAALVAEQNRYVTSTQIGVGVPGYLNEKAPYWRAIEEGTAYFVGKTIYGVFGESLTGQIGGSGAYGPYPLAGERYTGFGANRAGRLLPLGGMKALGITKASLGRSRFAQGPGIRDRREATRGVIQRPIVAQRYMRKAWKQFDARAVGIRMANEQIRILKQNLLP